MTSIGIIWNLQTTPQGTIQMVQLKNIHEHGTQPKGYKYVYWGDEFTTLVISPPLILDNTHQKQIFIYNYMCNKRLIRHDKEL